MKDKKHNDKLWQTSAGLDDLIEAYTVGDDHLTDMRLLPYDIEGTAAHVSMLEKIGVLSAREHKQVAKTLQEILDLHAKGGFSISRGQEDCHTAIEQYVTEKLGDTGKKIHTGRSRNDQALTMMRLYMKSALDGMEAGLRELTKVLKSKADQAKGVPMPGYTHMQKAMPSTVSDWLDAYADGFNDLLPVVRATKTLIDQNPLGSAAGFGVKGLEPDREHTAEELGFKKVQHNPLYCGLSRGYFELAVLQTFSLVMTLCGRFASDMLLFTTQEFGYFSLPPEFTTGSSIMPNKRNYDLFEIMRGDAKLVGGHCAQIQAILGGMTGGYQRDLSLTKEPFVKGTDLTAQSVAVLIRVVPELKIHEEALKASMTDDLYATEKVYGLVSQGVPFRDAYKQVKHELFGPEAEDDEA